MQEVFQPTCTAESFFNIRFGPFPDSGNQTVETDHEYQHEICGRSSGQPDGSVKYPVEEFRGKAPATPSFGYFLVILHIPVETHCPTLEIIAVSYSKNV